jgi:uncharacterized protein YbaR (Trm112 family)
LDSPAVRTKEAKVHVFLMEMLACPVCQSDLVWEVSQHTGDRIEQAEARCEGCAAVYPVLGGIGLFLAPDPPHEDLWEQTDSQLAQYLREHPEVEQLLVHTPVDSLGPADLYFRALAVEERGEYKRAWILEKLALERMYTRAYRSCWQSQIDYVIEQLVGSEGPIVDLASGRCYLVEQLVRRLECLIVATDFSPRVLRRDREWLREIGLYDRVSLLALDVRRMPFRAGSIEMLTTNVGLENIEEPARLMQELRRVVDGRFLAISHFFPPEDETNAAAAQEYGLIPFRREALDRLASVGWNAKAVNIRHCRTRPTPTSALLEGARIDAFPVVDTMLDWCTIDAR